MTRWSTDPDLHRHLEGLYKLLLSSREMSHAIRRRPDEDWQLFTPSQFIYAFFVFNALYTLRLQDLSKDASVRPLDYGNLPRTPREREQIKRLLRFAFEDDAQSRGFQVLRAAFGRAGLSFQETRRRLAGITVSNASRVTKADAGNMRKLVALLDGRAERPLAQLGGVLDFIYQVRCNVFHGLKTSVHAPEVAQCERFEVYTCVLQGVCEAAFGRAENLHLWRNMGDGHYLPTASKA